MIKHGFWLLFIVQMFGCSYLGSYIDVKYSEPGEPGSQVIEKKTTVTYDYFIKTNYQLNKVEVSHIGSPMLKVEGIVEKHSTVDTTKETITATRIPNARLIRPNKDFSITSSFQTRKFLVQNDLRTIKFSKQDTFTIMGTTEIDRKSFSVISNPKTNYQFLLDENGILLNGRFIDHSNYILLDENMKIEPIRVKFEKNLIPVAGKFMDSTHKEYMAEIQYPGITVINYELIYGGKDLTGLHIVYREYTKDKIARQAFYQNLNYERNAKTIRFKNTVIEVISADNQKITFRVVKDDIEKLQLKGRDNLPKKPKITVKNL